MAAELERDLDELVTFLRRRADHIRQGMSAGTEAGAMPADLFALGEATGLDSAADSLESLAIRHHRRRTPVVAIHRHAEAVCAACGGSLPRPFPERCPACTALLEAVGVGYPDGKGGANG